MDDDELAIVNRAAASAVEAAMRRQPGWRMIPGVVTEFDPGTFQARVQPDGDDVDIQAYIAVGVPVRTGDRVLVTFTNPGGAFVTGFIGLSRAVVGELSYNSVDIPINATRSPNFWEPGGMTFPEDWEWSTSSPWIRPTWAGWYYLYVATRFFGFGSVDVRVQTTGTNGREQGLGTMLDGQGTTPFSAAALVFFDPGARMKINYRNYADSTTEITAGSMDFRLAYLGSTPEAPGDW